MGNAQGRRTASFLLLLAVLMPGAEHQGSVKLGTLPVPGATVTAQQGTKRVSVLTDAEGAYHLSDLAEGAVTVKVEMLGFAPAEREVKIPGEAAEWTLSILPLAKIAEAAAEATVRTAQAPKPEIKRQPKVPLPAATNTTSGFQSTEVRASDSPVASAEVSSEVARKAADGLLVSGSVNNAASSPFTQMGAFGNNRAPGRWPYNGNLGFLLDNSSLAARPFSLTGQDTPRPAYNRLTGFFSFGGPVRIPGLLRNGPQFTLNYQWIRNRNVATQTALVPTAAEREGDLSQTNFTAVDPDAGAPFPGNRIPQSRISSQARTLLNLYPLPNFAGPTGYNFQIPLVNNLHRDSLQFRAVKQLGRRDNVSGTLVSTSSRTDNPDIFGFLATSRQLNLATTFNWRHTFHSRFFVNLGYQFTRDSSRNVPFFANRVNVSEIAGIAGNNQDPVNWGPPTLNFANGIATLGETQFANPRNQTNGVSVEIFTGRGTHSVTYGLGFRRTQWNLFSQQDPRGTFAFTGATTGSDFASFLLGIPDTASIAFGNADKYFRSPSFDAYISDEWRFRSGLSMTLGVRYEYNAPIRELYGRLVNLAIANHFASAVPIVEATEGSLIRPDRNNIAPRLGFAWRPLPASSMIVRGGYGVYYDNPLYRSIAEQMAQQAPLSTSLRVQNSPSNPLTLANGFRGTPNILNTTFGVDPDFRTGYAQNWQLSVQRDMPFALQLVATYLGIKGTRGVQQFLPNTYPAGAMNACFGCPVGFSYMTSNGNSTRHAGTLQLRRRLRRGFTADVQYTWAKAIDNAALAGVGFLIAQNWLDLQAERGRSNFDQRHVVAFNTQYTTSASGRKGTFLREWTVTTQMNFGTGMPLTPTYFSPVRGTGVTGSIRANYTGADIYDAASGRELNPAAFAVPAPDKWGNAGRNTITGPSQFTLNASASRTFRWGDRVNADLRVDATNVLNHPVFSTWNTVISSAQFGLPTAAAQMRTIQTSLRARF